MGCLDFSMGADVRSMLTKANWMTLYHLPQWAPVGKILFPVMWLFDQQFHIKAVHRKAVRTKPWFCSMFKEAAVLIACVLFPLFSFALHTDATRVAPEMCFAVLGEVSAFPFCPVWVVSTWTSLSGFPLQTDTELWSTAQPFYVLFQGEMNLKLYF